jgi:miniconductance mechanosensitive channel
LQRFALPIGIIGSVIGLIFQDTLKGVFAFIHLRLNNQISIGDWIIIPKHNVDGEVSRITLTHVTFYNWDTTTSTIPTSVLHSEHFQNLTNMMDGRTFGRKMSKTFILDTGWIHIITEQEADELKQSNAIIKFLSTDDIKSGVTNAQLYRLYLYHWLMNHPYVSQEPRLVVRWLEQKETGLPLQIYGFIMEGGVLAYEWQQSQIIEHIVEALDWFGLQLYQRPSNHDVSNIPNSLTEIVLSRKEETL